MKNLILKLTLLLASNFLLNVFAINQAGAQWSYSGNGIPLGVVYSMTSNDDYIFAGTLFGVYKSDNNGNSWTIANGGQLILYTQSVVNNNGNIYATSITNGVLKTSDNGQSWSNIGIPGVVTNKISIINENLFVGANNGIEKTSNQGSNWNNVLPLNSNGYEIKSFSGYLFASTGNGIYRSNDGGENWELISFSGQTINCLLVFNNSLFAGLENNGVWFSDDYGSNWLSLGLENISVYSLASYGNGILAGTNDGFYYSVDNCINWILNNDGLPTQSDIKSIFVSDPFVFSGTIYHGIYRRQLTDFGFTVSPLLLSPENYSVQVPVEPLLIWNSVHNAVLYEVVLSNNPNFNNYLIDQIVNDTSYQIPNSVLIPATQYYWKVKSFNSFGASEWSDVFSFTTLVLPPVLAPNLISPMNGSINIPLNPTLFWGMVEYATSYTCWVATDANFTSKVFDSTQSALQINIPEGILSPLTQYYWKIRASNSMGIGPWSLTYIFVTMNTAGLSNNISEIPKIFNLYNNYPNPFNPSTKIKFDIPKNSVVKINVYDITGREITILVNDFRNAGRYEVQFNASNLSSGIYFYKMQAGDYKAVRKMVLLK
jgi:hypothetical protein